MFCKNCGYNNDEDAKFCINCGTEVKRPLTNIETRSNNQEYTENTIQTKRKFDKTYLIPLIIIGVLVIWIGLGLLINSIGNTTAPSIEKSNVTTSAQKPTSTPKLLPTSTPTPTPTLSPEEYKVSALEIDYFELVREPDKYLGSVIKITVKISQVSPGGLFSTPFYAGYEDYELKLDEDSTFLDKRWYIPGLIEGDRKIIENDIVSFYGSFEGLVEMKLISGSKEFVPMLNFEYYENLSDVN